MESELRVFLSADLVGSTRLKNQLNHQELYEKYQARSGAVRKAMELSNQSISEELLRKSVFESLGLSKDDVDWAKVVEFFYDSFHAEFAANAEEMREKLTIGVDGLKPWKAVGDELIYQFRVASRSDLHWLTVAFLAALRSMDEKVENRGGVARGLRIKGSAWVAGFPVRNRKVQLPAVAREDFLGPDMDTGFRIGSCTRAGMLVVSVELAELLSEAEPGEVSPIVGKIVGWEKLKGVWNDHRYPIVWVDLPSRYRNDTFAAREFGSWEQAECEFCKQWESAPPGPLSGLVDELQRVRSSLPGSLGLVDPYIVGDPDDAPDVVPERHRRILELLMFVQEHEHEVEKQGTDESVASSEAPTEIDWLFEEDGPAND